MGIVTISTRDDSYLRRDGTIALYCTLYIGRQRVKIPVGVSVLPGEWDMDRQQVKGSSKEVKDKNLIVKNVKARVNDIFVRYRLENRELTKKTFLKEYNEGQTHADFWAFMEFELNRRKGTISDNTYRAQQSTLKKFKKVLPELQFREMNEDTIRELRKLLVKEYKNSQNTITKNLITLKTYVSIAMRKKYIDANPFSVEKIKRFKPNQVWLKETELLKLLDAYRKNAFPPNLHRVLQYFLFGCFTGMRLSDVKNFEMDQVKGDFIILHPIKTKRTSNEMVSIPITKPTRMILNDAARLRLHGKVFEAYADAVTNRWLKKIAEGVGVNKDISFHSARHTFASIFLEKTDDLATLQKLLGHSDIKQTMVYVHMTEKKKVEQMKKCWDGYQT
jgi:integrase/recombinase XerD